MLKIRLIFFFFCILFILIIAKLFYLQVISPFSQSQLDYLRYKKILPQRGRVYDRNQQPLVLNQTTYRLFVEPKKLKDKQKVIETIDKVLEIGEATLGSRIDAKKDWVAIQSGITKEYRDKLAKLNLEGIGFEENYQRYYPEASLAAHVLGFVGKTTQGEDTGYFGLEGYYNQDLTGLPGLIKTEKDLLGRYILLGSQEKIESENGRDLILTIDKSVQEIIKKQLLDGLERYKAKEGCVIVADPKNLEIFGLVCLPDFDLTKYYDFSENYFANNAIATLYEPGSIFKPLIMAAAINEKKVKPDDFYNENGPIETGGYEIRTWDNKYENGKITMTRILEKSSNVGMVYVGQKLGNKNILKYLRNYSLGSYTGIDLQGESSGLLKPPKEWYPIDYATVTFGQGIAITPMQMIRAFSSLINGGELLQPHVVKKIVYGDKEKEIGKKVIRRVIDEKTSEIIKKMLVSTVEHGEYKWVKPKGYKIGGKTGTAQIPIQGKYDPSKTIASFIGFAPADDPKFITLVVLREPKTSIYGSETAAPLFFEIAKQLFVYYNIAPEQ